MELRKCVWSAWYEFKAACVVGKHKSNLNLYKPAVHCLVIVKKSAKITIDGTFSE
jgi:hypothetical protein